MPQLDWNATINAIRDSLPQTQFQNWFKPLTLVRYDDTSVVVGVPSRFHEEWLKSHYTRELKQAIHKQCGSELQLEFEVLVMDENLEASLSNAPQPMGRPALRIVDSRSGQGSAQESESAEPRHLTPNVPQFTHPYFELGFCHVAYQCVQLLIEGSVPLNPLIIQAGVGMGKTHLLSEISKRLNAINPALRIRYTSAEPFTAEMVQSFKSDTSLAFKRKYREETDILLFDDLPGLSRKMRTQEELLHIFNEIIGRGGKVVFTSSISPQRYEDFIDTLKSRILSGVVAEVKFPTFEERVQILNKMAEHNRMIVEPAILNSLADKGQKDIRELIGTLLRVHLQAKIENKSLDNDFLAREGWAVEAKREAITMDEIIGLVEHNYAISRSEFVSKSRKSSTVWARQVAMYLARHYTLLPLEEIGKAFGRDHATVIHAFQKVTETMESQPTRRYEVEFLKQKLQSRGPRNQGFSDVPLL